MQLSEKHMNIFNIKKKTHIQYLFCHLEIALDHVTKTHPWGRINGLYEYLSNGNAFCHQQSANPPYGWWDAGQSTSWQGSIALWQFFPYLYWSIWPEIVARDKIQIDCVKIWVEIVTRKLIGTSTRFLRSLPVPMPFKKHDPYLRIPHTK